MEKSVLDGCGVHSEKLVEISIVGKPAIFIPLPSNLANRQEDNARVLEKLGAAKVILNSDLDGNVLLSRICDIIEDREELLEMGRMATKIAPEDVEKKILDEVINLVED